MGRKRRKEIMNDTDTQFGVKNCGQQKKWWHYRMTCCMQCTSWLINFERHTLTDCEEGDWQRRTQWWVGGLIAGGCCGALVNHQRFWWFDGHTVLDTINRGRDERSFFLDFGKSQQIELWHENHILSELWWKVCKRETFTLKTWLHVWWLIAFHFSIHQIKTKMAVWLNIGNNW